MEASAVPPAGRRTVGAGALLATVSQAVVAVALAALSILVARLLGPEDTGAFSVISTAVVLLSSLFSLGLGVGLTYEVSGGRWPAGDALRQVQAAAALFGVAGALAGFGVAVLGEGSFFEGVPLELVAVAVAALPFALSWAFSSALALSLDRYEAYALALSGQALGMLALAAVLTPLFGLDGAVAAVAASHAATAVGLLLWGTRALRPSAGWLRRTRADLRSPTRFGLKAYVTNALQLLNLRADLFVLNAVAPQAKVGQYAIALAVTTVGQFVPRSLASVVLPRVAALDTEAGAAEQQTVITKSTRHSVLIAAVTGVVVTVGVLLIPLVYGQRFEPARVPGLILVPGATLLGLTSVLSSTVVGKGYPQYTLRAALIVTPVTLALYALLIPPYEATGAAIASTASYTLLSALVLFYFRRVTGIRGVAELLPGRDELSDYGRLIARARRRAAG